ncbi:hypothetical protein Kpol_543p2 [Vanderwaltozyma polyspora DSM 70294]|uniref:Ammonia transport outward protein 3 n=1 Tax=Vanderwaltozyma polyspora (strain ATCC 22028 / DSM 70294 / BCRC 21397 / CBS 2163 / NBRC 10782 / NRRL Y-8283 / UCD 57-17) TaxID=436907 RepID=A7THK7_VANPO|nr:uncharacterized protein Kpol_543p2 [Vanderwaltozyma polyspora DSM 70294]EDO18173.1 hypothetical protein Kpol_543p2 [Vanderwaltozyma polyspora DSM 70294]
MSVNSNKKEYEGVMTYETSSSNEIEKQQTSNQYTRTINEIVTDGDLVTLGNHTYRRGDLLRAFNADVVPTSNQRQFANPIPLGLASFSFSCLVLSLVNANVRGVTENKFLISTFMFFGGAIELFAGLLCFVTGDTYAMTVFSSFGGFWICFGCINTDQFHSISAYGDDTKMLQNVTGFFLAGWVVFTFLMLMCTLKSTWGLFLLLFTLDLTFLFLCIGNFIGNNNVRMAGGYFGILSSCCGWYSLYCAVANDQNTYFPLRATVMPNFPTV